jgi:LAO/AO transport system kinase
MSLTEGILRGDRRAIARQISRIENNRPEGRSVLAELYAHTGNAFLVGITGAPGTGKSTLVNEIAKLYRQDDKTVAILSVDPTSPFTGGAILGDRIRMNDLAGDPGIFVRSMATRGSLGGLARAAADTVKIFDAAGYEIILIETVGVGQAEVEIASLAHSVVVVEAPGLGDEIQAIKAGVLEIADVFVVNQCDRDGSGKTLAAVKMMLDLSHVGLLRSTLHHG